MITFKHRLKAIVPESIWGWLAKRYRWTIQDLTWIFSHGGRRSRRRLRSFKDRYKGERVFIIGNGPSLNKMDLSPLHQEYTFGLNRIYLMFPKLEFATSFLVSVNRLVIEQFAEDLNELKIPKFIGWRTRNKQLQMHNHIYINNKTTLGFSKNAPWYVYEGGTVTYIAMQLAYFMGFRKIILIGVDHRFSVNGKPHEEVLASGPDKNHFDPNYFGKGVRWNLPDLSLSERAYSMAKQAFEKDHREVIDATVEGNLKIFPKTNYNDLFNL